MKNIFAAGILIVLISGFSGLNECKAQYCDSIVPYWVVDLTGHTDSLWISDPPIPRAGNCCGTNPPDNCVEFILTVDPQTIAINFYVASGAMPPGTVFYYINCGSATPVNTPVCVNGPGPHYITFCAPGMNFNTYGIQSIVAPSVPDIIYASEICSGRIIVNGFVESTLVYRDITGGGIYDEYLDFLSREDTVYCTPVSVHPPYVDYEVCGGVMAPMCDSMSSNYCDTVRVIIYDNVSGSVTPNPANYCASEGGLWLTATHSNGIPPYTYEWYDSVDGLGTLVGDSSGYFATQPGNYSVLIKDSIYPYCNLYRQNVIVTEYPSPDISINNTSPTGCPGSSAWLMVTGANSYLWSPASGLSGTTNDTVIASPAVTTDYTIIGTNTGIGCSDTLNFTYKVLPLPVTEAGYDDSICYGGYKQLSGSGGLIYLWSPDSSLSDPNIYNPVAIPDTTTTYTLITWEPTGNIIINGNFSAGNTGFYSTYSYDSNLSTQSRYYVNDNPNLLNPAFSLCGDHTSGTGNMLVVNGAPNAGDTIWYQTVNVLNNTDYALSVWIAGLDTLNPAELQFQINGVAQGGIIKAADTNCRWDNAFVIWNSGANNSATISVINQNVVSNGNDFAIDDIVFAPLCVNIDTVTIYVNPPTGGNVTNISCFGENDGSITAITSGCYSPYSYLWTPGGMTTQTINNLAPGNYTVIVTDSLGVQDTLNFSVTEPTLLAGAITDIQDVSCLYGDDGQAVVTAAGGTLPHTYLWSGGATPSDDTAYQLPAGIYYITVTDFNGCQYIDSVIIADGALVSAGTIIGQDSVIFYTNETYNVNSISGTTYQWLVSGGNISSGQGTDSVVIAWSAAGTGELYFISAEGSCTDTTSILVTIFDNTGIRSINADNIRIYPNPTTGLVKICCFDDNSEKNILITDMRGLVLLNKQFTEHSFDIDISEFSPGIYLLHVTANSYSIVNKVIKQ